MFKQLYKAKFEVLVFMKLSKSPFFDLLKKFYRLNMFVHKTTFFTPILINFFKIGEPDMFLLLIGNF